MFDGLEMEPSGIPKKESLIVEFKSDQKKIADTDLVLAVVGMANADGGDVYLGVEDDATVTGVHPEHQSVTGLAAMIANRTNPPVSVRVEALTADGSTVVRISVPKVSRPVASSDGTLHRRRLMADGSPENVPFYPHEIVQRQSQLGMLDFSAMPVEGSTRDDLDPLERQRLRQMVERYGGDRAILDLSDQELDGALGFVKREEGRAVPTVTGLLILGKESILRDKLPTHEVAFQVLDGTQVRVNDFYRLPLLRVFERVLEQFEARAVEEEVQVGLFRVPIPKFDKRAFREAFVNSLIHRDYTRLGAAHVRTEADGMVISNPGGFVEGVSLANLLVVEPKPRNPLLADAVKRIGLAERTGRGVDLIYEGMLRYGRPAPDYGRSDSTTVVVRLSGADADIEFLRVILQEEERAGQRLPLDSLIVLSRLRNERRLDISELGSAMQKDESSARSVVERLVERGLVDAHGVGRDRTYTLSVSLYRRSGLSTEYVRQAGFDRIQQQQMVLQYARTHGRITRRDVMDLCRLSEDQASRLLRSMAKSSRLRACGTKGRSSYYTLPDDAQ